jgi:hypothetical protein
MRSSESLSFSPLMPRGVRIALVHGARDHENGLFQAGAQIVPLRRSGRRAVERDEAIMRIGRPDQILRAFQQANEARARDGRRQGSVSLVFSYKRQSARHPGDSFERPVS